MQEVTTIGLDIAKSPFQVHGVNAGGSVTINRKRFAIKPPGRCAASSAKSC